jgi:hypothetical protein
MNFDHEFIGSFKHLLLAVYGGSPTVAKENLDFKITKFQAVGMIRLSNPIMVSVSPLITPSN